jgi:hypothetical protein
VEVNKMMKLSEKDVEAIIFGGGFFGGGGGGEIAEGVKIAQLVLSLGDLHIASIDEVPEECYIATASLIGAPSMRGYVKPYHMIRSAELFIDALGEELCGFISSEVGGLTVTNGWVQSVLLGIPVIDAPADGRAHPSGVMGSMGLHKFRDYISLQTAVGGSKEAGTYVEMVIRGGLQVVDRIVREASVRAEGMVAVTRNPVTKEYVKQNAAVGALSLALKVGYLMLEKKSNPIEMSEAIADFLGGRVVDVGIVDDIRLESKGGYDIGDVVIKGRNNIYRIIFWNEYMMIEDRNRDILALFPDLITIINIKTGISITSAEIRKGDEIVIVMIPKDRILLGSGVKDPNILKQVHEVIGMISPK